MQRWTMPVVWAAFAVALLPALGHADYYSYTKENGSKGYADELKNVPARYRASAERQAERPLSDYARHTRSETPVPAARSCAPCPLPEEQSPAARAHGARAPQAPTLTLEVTSELDLQIPDSADEADEPITVERRVFRWVDGRYRPYTIVRRGDRVLQEIQER
jgi:hypothetical protein